MNTHFTRILSTLAICACAPIAANATQLDFKIEGIKSDEGKIYIQVFKGEEAYKTDQQIAASVIEATKGDATISFDGLEAGEYVVRYFHDEDNDGELATNFVGIPTEGYGFSNAAKPNFGPPKYEDMKFQIDGEQAIVVNHSRVIY